MANLIQATISLDQPNFIFREQIHILPFSSTVELKNSHAVLNLHWMAFNFESIVRSQLFDQWFNYLKLTSRLTPQHHQLYQQRTKYFKTDTKTNLPFRVTYQLTGEDHQETINTMTNLNGHCQISLHISDPTLVQMIAMTKYVTGQFRYGSQRFQLSFLVNNFSIPNPYRSISSPTFRVVISDIDDTIKYSNVLDKTQLLINTFLRPFVPIQSVTQLIKQQSADFYYYVSSSPYQLWPFLYQFLTDNNLPQPENIRLRQLVSHNMTNLLQFIENGPTYKINTITEILQHFPDGCEVYLYGDSGEKDPEIYNQIAVDYPSLVKQIVIRNVTPGQKEAVQERFSPSLWPIVQVIE